MLAMECGYSSIADALGRSISSIGYEVYRNHIHMHQSQKLRLKWSKCR